MALLTQSWDPNNGDALARLVLAARAQSNEEAFRQQETQRLQQKQLFEGLRARRHEDRLIEAQNLKNDLDMARELREGVVAQAKAERYRAASAAEAASAARMDSLLGGGGGSVSDPVSSVPVVGGAPGAALDPAAALQASAAPGDALNFAANAGRNASLPELGLEAATPFASRDPLIPSPDDAPLGLAPAMEPLVPGALLAEGGQYGGSPWDASDAPAVVAPAAGMGDMPAPAAMAATEPNGLIPDGIPVGGNPKPNSRTPIPSDVAALIRALPPKDQAAAVRQIATAKARDAMKPAATPKPDALRTLPDGSLARVGADNSITVIAEKPPAEAKPPTETAIISSLVTERGQALSELGAAYKRAEKLAKDNPKETTANWIGDGSNGEEGKYYGMNASGKRVELTEEQFKRAREAEAPILKAREEITALEARTKELAEQIAGARQGTMPGASGGSSAARGALDRNTAAAILREAGGDKAKAREMARQRGYTL